MRITLLLVALASVASAGPFGVPKKMVDGLKHWSYLSSCIGKDNMDTYHKLVKETMKECQKKPTVYTKEDLLGKAGVCGVRRERR